MNPDRAIVKQEPPVLSPALEHLAEQIARSTIIPKEFAGSPANCLIALEMAHRIGAGVLQVMQSLYVVHGHPSWSGQFVIAAVNSTKRFTSLRFEFNADKTSCVAVAEDPDGNILKGPEVSVEMAKKEGWWQRNPKWQNLTELMLMYRSGTFFGRVYCPDVLMGMREQYEVIEAEAVVIKEPKIPSQTTKDIIADAAGEAPVKGKHFTEGGLPLPVVDPETKTPPPAEPTTPVRPKKKQSSAKPSANSATTSTLKLKTETPSTNEKVVGPHRKALADRLAQGNYTEAEFLTLALHHGWLGKGKQWASMDDIPDEMFEVFLQPEEWPTVMEELDKRATPTH